jgi:hypothetical protein
LLSDAICRDQKEAKCRRNQEKIAASAHTFGLLLRIGISGRTSSRWPRRPLTPGKATISFKSASGVPFSPWGMTVVPEPTNFLAWVSHGMIG